MNRLILGAVGALLMGGVGLFWIQGRAEVERAAPPPDPAALARDNPDPEVLPVAHLEGLLGPEPPEASELTREQRRFFRYDRNRDMKITRNEMLSSRTEAFRKLDTDGNNLLDFEEWAIATSTRFAEMDANGDSELSPGEFRRSAPTPTPRATPRCSC